MNPTITLQKTLLVDAIALRWFCPGCKVGGAVDHCTHKGQVVGISGDKAAHVTHAAGSPHCNHTDFVWTQQNKRQKPWPVSVGSDGSLVFEEGPLP